jgi:hypothetical protein
MGVKVNRCDIVPPISGGGGGAPVDAPYLTNGVDPNGDLTANVNVLALAAPQPFIVTAPIFEAIGQPLTIAYNPGAAGAANTGAAIGFRAQNDANAAVQIGSVAALMTDATAGSVDSALALNVSAASATVTAALVDNTGIVLDGSGTKTITTSKGNLTVSATGAGNDVTVQSGSAAAALTGATTATVQAGSGAATLQSTAAGAAVLGATTASLTATTGAASVVATAGAASVTGGTTAAITAGTNVTVEGASTVLLRSGAAGNGVQVLAGAVSTWTFMDPTINGGALTSIGSTRKVANVLAGTVAGDAIVYQQIFDAGTVAPTNGGATVPIVPGAQFIAPATFTAPTGGAGTFLLQNNTGRDITVIGVRALIPGAAANTLAITVASPFPTNLFAEAVLAATGGALSPATTYTLAAAVIANGADITITAEGSAGTVDVILLLEFIVQ